LHPRGLIQGSDYLAASRPDRGRDSGERGTRGPRDRGLQTAESGWLSDCLDDFAPDDPRIPLVEFADIIKVDIRATRPEERVGMMRRFGSPKCKMLAEKVETPHEFQQARDMGFVYFQGYFFCRPELVISREVPASRLHYMRLLEMVSRIDLDMRELEKCSNRKPRFPTACFAI
jgi:c-di-GMP-related signal transduction protein